MGKIRLNGYIFNWNAADHFPIHIHVYKDKKLVCRWRLFESVELSGKANSKIKKTIYELQKKGVFEVLERVKNENP